LIPPLNPMKQASAASPRAGRLFLSGYGTVYGMKKTTVYLPDELKAALERAAALRGQSEAEIIREAVRELIRGAGQPKPRLPLFSGGDPTLAERFEEELRGFGE